MPSPTKFAVDAAPANDKVIRRRKGGSRSKTGCITCRVRRLKCDEAKPECVRCTSTGRKCDGYPSIFAATNPWEVVYEPALGSIIRPSSNPRVASSDHAARSFKFFQDYTAVYLAGVFDFELWNEVFLRAAQHNDALWQAAVALASAHEIHLKKENGESVYDDWTLQQYNRAIRALTQPNAGQEPTIDVMIATSVLFMGFEMLRREIGRAIGHIRSGINMFSEYSNKVKTSSLGSSQPAPLVPLGSLEKTLRRMEIQLCELSLDRYPDYNIPRRNGKCFMDQRKESDMPSNGSPEFDSLIEAKEQLDDYWHDLMFMLHDLSEPGALLPITHQPEEFNRQSRIFQEKFATWSHAFKSLVAKMHSRRYQFTSKEKKAVAQLEMHHMLGVQIVETYLSVDEMIWDRYRDRFLHILDLCYTIASSEHFGDPACSLDRQTAHCGFQIDMGFVAACFHVIWKCRDARARVRAIQIMQKYPRQEGLWDGRLVPAVARTIDSLERGPDMLDEAAARGDGPEVIPAHARILAIDIMFSSDSKHAVIQFTKQKSEDDGGIVNIRRTFEW